MSPKKIFIVAGVVVIIIISIIMLYLLFQKKEIALQEQKRNQESAVPVTLPSGTKSSMAQKNIELTQKIFENVTQERISEETEKEGFRKVDFKNQKGDLVSLSDFEEALDVKIYPKLREYLNNDYQIFYCPGAKEKKEFGVYLRYDMEKIYRGFTYDVINIMKDWENTVLLNLHTVLFPNIGFSESNLSQEIKFKNGKYRYAEINLPSGEKGSIQYDNIEFGILIATSPSCLDKVHQYYEPMDPIYSFSHNASQFYQQRQPNQAGNRR